MRNIKAICFDLDGVLTDTAEYHFLAWKTLADNLGYTFDRDINERLKGVSRMKSLEIILEVNSAEGKFTEEEKEKLAAEKNDIYKELIKKVTPDDILPGVAEFIEKAKSAGMKLAVASVSKNARTVLEGLDLTEKFDYIADASKITKSKPDPEIFLTCAEALKISPQDCIGIEDAAAGIKAINSAGMFSVGINVSGENPLLPLNSTKELDFEKIVKTANEN